MGREVTGKGRRKGEVSRKRRKGSNWDGNEEGK